MNYLPVLLSEQLVQSQFFFKFWLNGVIHDGLRYQRELFQLCRTFDNTQRDEVYKIGCELEGNGIKAVITVSGSQYRLWSNLRGATSKEDRGGKDGGGEDGGEKDGSGEDGSGEDGSREGDRHHPFHSRIPYFASKPAIPNPLLPRLILQFM